MLKVNILYLYGLTSIQGEMLFLVCAEYHVSYNNYPTKRR